MYVGFALYVENAIVPYCCKEKFELVPFTFELKKRWWRCGWNIKELEVPGEDQTLLAPGSQYHLVFLTRQYKFSISSAEQGLKKIV